MKIEGRRSHWGSQIYFGPYIEWQEWNVWHHTFDIGFYFGPWIFYLTITLWDVEKAIEMLKGRGMTQEEAWNFCDGVRRKQPDPYDSQLNMQKEIEKALPPRHLRPSS